VRLLDSLKAGELDAVLMAFPHETPGLETAIVGDDPLLLAFFRDIKLFESAT
jgi:hypothetical protein